MRVRCWVVRPPEWASGQAVRSGGCGTLFQTVCANRL